MLQLEASTLVVFKLSYTTIFLVLLICTYIVLAALRVRLALALASSSAHRKRSLEYDALLQRYKLKMPFK
jgi:hypothetical protein